MFKYLSVATMMAFMLGASPLYAQSTPFGPGSASAMGIKNMETRLSAVEDQMRELTGKVEKFDFALGRIEDSLKKMQEDYDLRLTELEKKPTPPPVLPPSSMDNESAMPQRITGTLGSVRTRNGHVTSGRMEPSSPPLPEVPDDYGLTPQEMYDRAFGLLRQADYENAELAFSNFIDKYPKDKLVNNAKYWYAETYYVRGMFGDAAVAFAEAYQHNPRGGKAPDSLLKLAMSLASVEKKRDACSTLKALKTKYPKASSTIKDRAKSEWVRLQCK